MSDDLARRTYLVKYAAVTYMRSLKRQWQADHDEEAAKKRQKKLDDDKLYGRRHRVSLLTVLELCVDTYCLSRKRIGCVLVGFRRGGD